MTTEKPQIGRLAMRVEGGAWNAYYALNETMQGALFLGGITIEMACNETIKAGFMELMKEAVTGIIEAKTGVRPVWPDPPEPAPEHERAGRA